MLKCVPVADLSVGMFLHRFDGAWINHPFWRQNYLLTTEAEVLRSYERSLREGDHEAAFSRDLAARMAERLPRRYATIYERELEVVVDREAPLVASRLPASGADEWDGVIAITASEPLAASSVVEASVKLLEDGTELQKKLVLSADGKTVTVVPAQALALPSALTVELSPVWTDLAGNPLDQKPNKVGNQKMTWTFTVI